ncbi:hypothetical protein Ddye_029809 [Dipteronia dyeriana]|uniref:PPIase cyclophilin-type domain-containing protein n=1 Tax=Dipteronia dyeriana TaxID=168575 RepID=A0AAD9TF87_9ROSI|nr:hypothetical protein Ddye_029809 [Dipteronia dyeriana]
MLMPLFPWKDYDYENSSDYYKSMKVKYLCSSRKASKKKKKLEEPANGSDEEKHGEAMEEGATSLMKSKSRNSYQPSSRKRLFHGRDCETFKSKLQTSVPYNIPDLYSAIVDVIKQKKFDGDMAGLEKVESFSENVVGESYLEQVVGSPVVSKKVDGDMAIEKKPLNVYEYSSPAVNVVLPIPTLIVVFMDAFDPNVCYKNNDQKRGSKRSRFLGSSYVDPMPKKKRKSQDLSENTVLRTVENFRALCTGEKGIIAVGKPLHYKGSTFHNVVPGYVVYGGDISNENRTGGESIYGPTFANENFVKKHIGPDILSMAKTGTGGNDSQFIICTSKAEWLDCKQVVFDQMVEGFDVLKVVDKIGSISDLTSKVVMVIDCGLLC